MTKAVVIIRRKRGIANAEQRQQRSQQVEAGIGERPEQSDRTGLNRSPAFQYRQEQRHCHTGNRGFRCHRTMFVMMVVVLQSHKASGVQHLRAPAIAVAFEHPAFVEAEFAILPEFDAGRANDIPGPVRRAGYIPPFEARFHSAKRASNVARLSSGRDWSDAHAPNWESRARLAK
jgi:hypothetical protein